MFLPRVRVLVAAPVARLIVPLLASFSIACSGSSGNEAGEFGGEMYVVSCSLGCSNGIGGERVFCAVIDTYRNQEIAVLFSEPVEPFSVGTSSFRVVNVANGTTPVGQFFVDPTNPRRLVFRPALTFDEIGRPVFGFEENAAYEVTIPGTADGDAPPFVRSVAGRANTSRVQCTILTTRGVLDPTPGDPELEILVDVVTEYNAQGEPAQTATRRITSDPVLTDVFRDSQLTFVFRDIMNPATLVNPSTGQAPFLDLWIDTDGVVATSADRLPLEGSFFVEVDLERIETQLTFTPTEPLPSAGPDTAAPNHIVIVVPPGVSDLLGHPMRPENGGGVLAFVPEAILFEPISIPSEEGVPFLFSAPDPSSAEDLRRSGAVWGSGRLVHGHGGGSGRLGDLILTSGQVVVLNTDEQAFPLGLAAANVVGNADASGHFPASVTVTDGVFEFGTVVIESGAVLRLEGLNPARIYARGGCDVEAGSVIDVSGSDAAAHDSRVALPALTLELQAGPPNAGDGGFGADRFDHSNSQSFPGQAAPSDPLSNPGAITRGRDGGGVGRAVALGEGRGGIQFPELMPTESLTNNPVFPHSANSDIQFNAAGGFLECRSAMVGGVGSGGAYATAGGPGVAESNLPVAEFPSACCLLDPTPVACPACDTSNSPPPTAGGDSSQLALAPPNPANTGYVRRLLEWQNGFLAGGSGGGGGGNHQYWTATTGSPGIIPCIANGAVFNEWHDHSGASGGSGGGALHLVAGKQLFIGGVVDASGGRGGSALNSMVADDYGRFAMPGGGGSGGAIKLQGLIVSLDDTPGRLDVRGGAGGSTFFDSSRGGTGGTGLIRIEDANTGPEQIDPQVLASRILPEGPQNSVEFLSVAPHQWQTPAERPGSMSSSSSCWIRPEGIFLSLRFHADDGPAPQEQAWNMDVLWEPAPGRPEVVVPFRGTNELFPGSFEDEFGRLLGHDLAPGETAAPIVVRFQGARTSGQAGDLCDLDVASPTAPIVRGSLTEWVDHPQKLNDWPIPPNMVRFMIVFDGTLDPAANDTPGEVLYGNIRGVTNLRMGATPE